MVSPTTLLISLSAFAGLALAQGNYTIDPNSVDLSTRSQWCLAQENACPDLCPDSLTGQNYCDDTTLSYNCTCNDGTVPDLANYTNTIPFFECETWISQCITAHPNDATGQAACGSVAKNCATLNPANATQSTSSSSSSTSATPTSSAAATTSAAAATTTAASSASASATKASSANAIRVGQEYGAGILVAGLLAAFGLAL